MALIIINSVSIGIQGGMLHSSLHAVLPACKHSKQLTRVTKELIYFTPSRSPTDTVYMSCAIVLL